MAVVTTEEILWHAVGGFACTALWVFSGPCLCAVFGAVVEFLIVYVYVLYVLTVALGFVHVCI